MKKHRIERKFKCKKKKMKEYICDYYSLLDDISSLIKKNTWNEVKKEKRLSNFILNVLRDIQEEKTKENKKILRAKKGTYAPDIAEDIIGVSLREFLKFKNISLKVVINGQVGKGRKHEYKIPDITLCRKYKPECSIDVKDAIACIEISTGTGWSGGKKKFKEKISKLERITKTKKKNIFLIFFDVPRDIKKKVEKEKPSKQMIKEFKKDIFPQFEKNICFLSTDRWKEDTKPSESLEEFFEKIYKVVKNA